MLFVMVRGRHRGLPLAIDRSILLPGEELMRRMDKEYSEQGARVPENLEDLCENIKQCGEVLRETGETEQDPERSQVTEFEHSQSRAKGITHIE
jgi:hypothetical protein